MINFLLLMLVPVIIALTLRYVFSKKITWLELGIQLGVVTLFVLLGMGIAYWGQTRDVEVWNGQVTDKQRVEVSCSHSYSCNCVNVCTSDGKGGESCSEVCQTCYEHNFDVDWRVSASTGEELNIDRIDRQGLGYPPRWNRAYIGEPFASQHTYKNYIKANPDSVLLGTKGDMQTFGKLIPPYPSEVFDYYYNTPVINMGVPNLDVNLWAWLIRESNKTLGPSKQVHLIVIFVPTSDRAYMYALKDAWLGGKKNDVDIVIGSKDGKHIDFADILSWSTNKALAVDIKNRIQDIGDIERRDDINAVIYDAVNKEFVRMHMKDMEWLVRSYQPSGTAMKWLFGLASLLSIGLSILFINIDIDSYERY